jgi:hypothetical protein
MLERSVGILKLGLRRREFVNTDNFMSLKTLRGVYCQGRINVYIYSNSCIMGIFHVSTYGDD